MKRSLNLNIEEALIGKVKRVLTNMTPKQSVSYYVENCFYKLIDETKREGEKQNEPTE